MKRFISTALLAGMLLASMSLPAYAADTAVSSQNGNIFRYSVNGDTLSVFGRLNIPDAEQLWIQCGNPRYSNSPNCKIFSITPGEYFSVDLDLSSLTSVSDINVFYAKSGASSFAAYDYKRFSVVPKISDSTGQKYWDININKNVENDGAADAAYSLFQSILEKDDTSTQIFEKATTLTSSYNPDNYFSVTIEGNKVIASGVLKQVTGNFGWLKFLNNNNHNVIFNIMPGTEFCHVLPLSDITNRDYVSLLTGESRFGYYSYHFDDSFLIKKDDNGSYYLELPPLAEHNMQMMQGWVNLDDTFDSEITDAVRAKSNEICAGITDDYEKLWALYNWVAENIYYDYDGLNGISPIVYSPDEVLHARRSVCEGYAALLEAFCEAQGIPALRTATYAAGISNTIDFRTMIELPANTNHAHTEAFVNGHWVIMDPTWDSNNRYQDGTFYTKLPGTINYFDVPADFFAADHIILERDKEIDRTDIPSEWAKAEILAAMEQNLVHPDLQGDYVLPITRAEFSKLIVNAMLNCGIAAETKEIDGFSDSKDTYVLQAAAMGIVSGNGDGTFRPNDLISRQEAAVMLNRVANIIGITPEAPLEFADIDKTASWARSAVLAVSGMVSETGARVMGGVGTGFDPKGTYTRQQAILTVLRLMNCR